MLTSSTRILDRAFSATRPSMPSYRPQAKISQGSVAYWAARRCVNGTPAGVGITSSGPAPAAARRVVYGSVYVVGPAAQVVHTETDVAALSRLSDERQAERPEVLRKD